MCSNLMRFKRKRQLSTALILALLAMVYSTFVVFAGDPTGETYLAESDNATQEALTFIWLAVCGALVFFMQAGFALLEAGFSRSKNTVNVITKNVMDFAIAALAYFFFGYAIMYGASVGGFIGSEGFLLLGDYYDVLHARDWFFQVVFAATAATIVSGAMAERTRITAYMAYSFLVTALIYPISGHWVWSDDGWLGAMGYHDFAGSGVVHMVGGFIALAGAYMVGPRLGKYNADGTPNEFKPTNVVYVALGGLILFFGWFGFNAGSTLDGSDLRLAVVLTNTFLAASAGATVVMYTKLVSTGKADGVGSVNGILAGLVAITVGCAVVAPWGAVVIGALGGFTLIWGEKFVERTLKIDDPVGAITVHGIVGLLGVILVGVFADGTYGVGGLIVGDVGQFVTQVIGGLVLAGWSLIMGFIMFAILKATMGIRATDEEQTVGLDISEHGMSAYETDAASTPAAEIRTPQVSTV
jgi:ammonium transporter, Amt family